MTSGRSCNLIGYSRAAADLAFVDGGPYWSASPILSSPHRSPPIESPGATPAAWPLAPFFLHSLSFPFVQFSLILFLLFFVFSLSPVFRSEAARPCCVVFQLLGRRRPVARWPRWRPPSALILSRLSRLSSSAPLATIRDYATNHHHHHHHRHNWRQEYVTVSVLVCYRLLWLPHCARYWPLRCAKKTR